MVAVKIRTYKGSGSEPATTITIPGGVLRVARHLIPAKAVEALKEQGIDLDALATLSENPEPAGKLAEIEDHKKNERVVISME